MAIPKFVNRGDLESNGECSNAIVENLLHKCDGHKARFFNSVDNFIRGFTGARSTGGGSRAEEEEKVYLWLYALAQSDKDLVFEYVQSTERGLSFFEAERRLKETGPNIPLQHSSPKRWRLLWNAFFHSFNIILIILSILSYIAGDSPNGFIMLALVFVSVSLRLYEEFSSVNATTKLTEFVKRPVKVQRCAGRVVQTELVVQVDEREIVPGDIILFQPGDLFPGDVRLLTSKQLVVSQSSLTGEWGTMEKTADVRDHIVTPLLELKNICFMGTSVVSGTGSGLVISTGKKAYMSTMFSTNSRQRRSDPFEGGVRRLSYVLVAVMIIVGTLVGLLGCFTSHTVTESLLFAISMASALAPQLLPLIVNTSLAKGAIAMARDRCIVKSITALRDMGSMDVLCIDKTGTLTMDSAVMVNYIDIWLKPREAVLRYAFLNSYFKTEQKYPLDDAILAYVYTNRYSFRPSTWTKLDEIPFDFTRRRVSVILQEKTTGESLVISKGALEEVVKACCFIQIDSVGLCAFCGEDHRRVLSITEELSNDGLRYIGVAVKTLNIRLGSVNYENVEGDMVFMGMITFFDPPKDCAERALHRLGEKGIQAKVLTGDTLSLATKLCREVGIDTGDVITGPELELLEPDDFDATVERSTVLARLNPVQKLQVVRSLQKRHVVGFLGDGINDSKALRAADVGISVDSGASVAKDSADIILLEKDLNVLVAGVERGRTTFANTMKYIKMSVTANLGSVLSIVVATVFLGFEPLTARQLLVQSFLYNVGQIAIPWDSTDVEFVNRPRKWSERGLVRFVLWNGPVSSLCDVGTIAFLYFYYGVKDRDERKFVYSAFFVEGLLMQTLMIHLMRTEKIPFIQEIPAWPLLFSTIFLSAIGISIPFTTIGKAMQFVALPFSYFCFLILLFVFYFLLGQIVKRLYISTYNNWL